jgi:hypothetical protein
MDKIFLLTLFITHTEKVAGFTKRMNEALYYSHVPYTEIII